MKWRPKEGEGSACGYKAESEVQGYGILGGNDLSEPSSPSAPMPLTGKSSDPGMGKDSAEDDFESIRIPGRSSRAAPWGPDRAACCDPNLQSQGSCNTSLFP